MRQAIIAAWMFALLAASGCHHGCGHGGCGHGGCGSCAPGSDCGHGENCFTHLFGHHGGKQECGQQGRGQQGCGQSGCGHEGYNQEGYSPTGHGPQLANCVQHDSTPNRAGVFSHHRHQPGPHLHHDNYQPPPPQSAGAVAYPYYTTRGPRDFLSNNPRGIGR